MNTVMKEGLLPALLLALAGCGFFVAPSPGPPDATVRVTYRKHQAVFERLHTMIHEDEAIQMVGDDMIMFRHLWLGISDATLDDALTASGLSHERYDEYMLLLRKVEAYRVSIPLNDTWEQTHVHIHRSGIVPEGFTVGVVRMERTQPGSRSRTTRRRPLYATTHLPMHCWNILGISSASTIR